MKMKNIWPFGFWEGIGFFIWFTGVIDILEIVFKAISGSPAADSLTNFILQLFKVCLGYVIFNMSPSNRTTKTK